MAYELRPGQGSLFKNDKKTEGDNRPHYTGSVNINGVEHWLSAWIKDGAKGKFMSLAVGEPKQKQAGAAWNPPAPDASPPERPDYDDSEIPF